MSTIVSALTFTKVDQAGNPRVEAWLTMQFGEAYADGGVAFNLSPYFRAIEHIQTSWMSGAAARAPISGASVLSGGAIASGSKLQAHPVFQDYTTPLSTRFTLQGVMVGVSGFGAIGVGVQDVGSGALVAAVSGVRFLAHVLGY